MPDLAPQQVHEIKQLARSLDRQRRTLDASRWPTLAEDVVRLRAVEWAGKDGTCPDCRRSRRYGHQCGCPIRLALKYLGPTAEAVSALGTSEAVP